MGHKGEARGFLGLQREVRQKVDSPQNGKKKSKTSIYLTINSEPVSAGIRTVHQSLVFFFLLPVRDLVNMFTPTLLNPSQHSKANLL